MKIGEIPNVNMKEEGIPGLNVLHGRSEHVKCIKDLIRLKGSLKLIYIVTIMNNPVKTRLNSIDLLRGLVMVLMALDHTRDYFHRDAFIHNPLDLNSTSTLLYFTRYITHYCAPVFVFLSGISIYLQNQR